MVAQKIAKLGSNSAVRLGTRGRQFFCWREHNCLELAAPKQHKIEVGALRQQM